MYNLLNILSKKKNICIYSRYFFQSGLIKYILGENGYILNVVSEFICYYTILHWLCKLQEVCISSMLILLKGLWPVYMFQNLKWLVIYFMWSGLLFIVIVDLRSFCSTFYHLSNMAYELWAHQVARILLFIYFFVHMAVHFDQVSGNWTWK